MVNGEFRGREKIPYLFPSLPITRCIDTDLAEKYHRKNQRENSEKSREQQNRNGILN